MIFAIVCTIDPQKLDVLTSRRADHYRFLVAHRTTIRFGGPARTSDDERPETMIMIVETPTFADAQRFIATEPYNRQGAFSNVTVRPWSQVLPESTPGALEATLATLK